MFSRGYTLGFIKKNFFEKKKVYNPLSFVGQMSKIVSDVFLIVNLDQ